MAKSIEPELAVSLGRRDEKPNVELAERVARTRNADAVTELVGLLQTGNKDLQADALKTLYEIGERTPELIAPHAKAFIALLDHTNNRMIWGAMCAIDAVTLEAPKIIFAALPKMLKAGDSGSVITKDHLVKTLAKLATIPAYKSKITPLLLEQVEQALPNQFPSYAETAAEVVAGPDASRLAKILRSRLPDIEQDTKRKRIEKVLRKLEKANKA